MENAVRLVKFLSMYGDLSRRKAGDEVKAGHVTVNEITETNPGRAVSGDDRVKLNGRLLVAEERKVYVMLNKPRGYTCTNDDPHADKKAVDLIKLDGNPRLFSAGRLDKDSEGLLILSNDGDYVNRLTHPSFEILKVYEVELKRTLTAQELQTITKGIADEGEMLHVKSVRHLSGCRYEFILNEGKKREIRRIARAVNAPVVTLKRLQIGNLKLGKLPAGKFVELTPGEVNQSLLLL